MKAAKTAVRMTLLAVVAVACLQLTTAESKAIEPIGYEVQALCFFKPGDGPRGNFWMPVETFDNYEDAELYIDFLLFLADHDWRKLEAELGFNGSIYVHGYDYRIRFIYGHHGFYSR